jgi:hypothetical protein
LQDFLLGYFAKGVVQSATQHGQAQGRPMRYKARLSTKSIEQQNPFHVDIPVPEGGLRRRIDEMHQWHRDRGFQSVMGSGGMNVARFCFKQAALAEEFAKTFKTFTS